MDCVDVCPVDCFYEGEKMLVIHPDECIDCGVCVPECPVDAIKPDTEPGLEKWLSLNAEYAKIWPNITVKRAPPTDSKEWEGKPDKLPYFSPNPGVGDCGGQGQRPPGLRRAIGNKPKPLIENPAKDHEFLRASKDRSIRRVAGLHRASLHERVGRRFARRSGVSSLPRSGLFVPHRVCSRLRALRLQIAQAR